MTTLRATINELASTFAAGVLSAIRGASLEEILAETNRGGSGGAGAGGGAARRGPGRPRGSASAAGNAAGETSSAGEDEGAGRRGRRGRRGRLGRRSSTDIAAIVDSIVSLLGSNPNGLRAEEIRQQLGLEANELPRPIKEALDSKRISKQGQKRATTYFARGAGGRGAGAAKAGSKRGGGAAKKAATTRGGRKAKRAGAGGKRGRKASSASQAQSNGTTAEAAS